LGHEQVFAPLAYQSDARTMTHDYTRHGTITLFALGRFGAAIVDQRSADFSVRIGAAGVVVDSGPSDQNINRALRCICSLYQSR
jgi:hypothetical protein